MSDVRPPTHNELRWAMRKISQLIKQVDILEQKVAQLESRNAVGDNSENELVEQVVETVTEVSSVEVTETLVEQPKKRGRKKTTTEA